MQKYPPETVMAKLLAVELMGWSHQMSEAGDYRCEIFLYRDIVTTKTGETTRHDFGIGVNDWIPYSDIHQAVDCAERYEEMYGTKPRVKYFLGGWIIQLERFALYEDSLCRGMVKVMYANLMMRESKR